MLLSEAGTCCSISLMHSSYLWQSFQVGGQSMEMLKVRAALEERLKQKGILSSIAPKPDKAQKHLKPVNGYFSPLFSV